MTTTLENEVKMLEAELRNAVNEFSKERARLFDPKTSVPLYGSLQGAQDVEEQLRSHALKRVRLVNERLIEIDEWARAEIEAAEESPLSTLQTSELQAIQAKAALYAEDAKRDLSTTLKQARAALRSANQADKIAYLRAIKSYIDGVQTNSQGVKPLSPDVRNVVDELEQAVVPEHVRSRSEFGRSALERVAKMRFNVSRSHYELTDGLRMQHGFEQVFRNQEEMRPYRVGARASGDPI